MNLYAISSAVLATAIVTFEAVGPAVLDEYATPDAVYPAARPTLSAPAIVAPPLVAPDPLVVYERPAARVGVAAVVPLAAPSVLNAARRSYTSRPQAPSLTGVARLRAHLEAKVLTPIRDRDVGRLSFSRAGPMWDAKSMQLALADDAVAVNGWVPFRLEAHAYFGGNGNRTIWLGRIDPSTLAVQMAYPVADVSKAAWMPAAKAGALEED